MVFILYLQQTWTGMVTNLACGFGYEEFVDALTHIVSMGPTINRSRGTLHYSIAISTSYRKHNGPADYVKVVIATAPDTN